jgi:chorismate synthase
VADARTNSPSIEIRALHSDADLQRCVELQRATWGADYDDIVPPSVLKVAQKVGGVAAGAFDESGRMVGFVFGMAGVRDGRIIHWSDMLAVRAEARDHGVGQRLKEFQRNAARASGATTMYWTYDPLVARNAHMNFNRLGVMVDEYVEDMYGASESDLHRGLGTDRFIVAWSLDDDRRAGNEKTAISDAPVMNVNARTPTAAELLAFGASRPTALRVEIPLDIVAVRDAAPSEAVQWRASTRQAFQWALANGYSVERFVRDAERQRGHYVMALRATGGVR